jgi:hypothetical protein
VKLGVKNQKFRFRQFGPSHGIEELMCLREVVWGRFGQAADYCRLEDEARLDDISNFEPLGRELQAH